MTSIEDLLNKARKLHKDKRYEDSIEILENLFKKNPQSEDIKKELINVLFSYGIYLSDEFTKEFKKAIKYFNKILEIDPKNYRAIYNIGIAHFNMDDINNAMRAYNTAIKIKPDYKHCYYNIGLIYEVKENLKEALKFYKKALEIDPKFIYALQAKKYVKEKLNAQKREIPDS
ncbi:MAG: tetratricopeptide repeat protein [Promethearchaeota archaeon]|nr:MAG: tetratricopeptide repeat protein [Candidatus Lokiarchaeota archaeon]